MGRMFAAWMSVCVCLIFVAILAGCGSASSGGSTSISPVVPPVYPANPAVADFSLAISPTTVSVVPGGSQTTTISIAAINGFASQVSVSITGLPTGITLSPATFSLAPGASQQVVLSAALTASSGNFNATVQASSGTLSHTAQVAVGISDFSVAINPSSVSLANAGTQTATVSVGAINGFASSVSVSITGLPSGVTVSPTVFSLLPGASRQVTFTASGAIAGYFSSTLQATSGGLTHTVPFGLNLLAQATSAHAPVRTRYLRTNSFYDLDALQYSPPHFAVYDAAHRQFFVSNPYLNEIDVFDAVQEVQTAAIPVPAAWGLDIAPGTNSLYSGTLVGDIYVINTATLTVAKRYPFASIGPNGYATSTALVLSDGRLALQGEEYGAGLGIDGYGLLAVWNPATNALDRGLGNGSICTSGGSAVGGAFELSGDRTRILSTWVESGGGGNPICSYDPVARVETYGNFNINSNVRQIIPTADGKRFFVTSNLFGVGEFDAHTVQMLGQIAGNGSATLPSAAGGAVLSLDGKTLYLVGQTYAPVAAYDTTTLQPTGFVPSLSIQDAQFFPVIGAIDETGLLVGPIGHGVAFLDASTLKSSAPTSLGAGLANPNVGPLSGGTATAGFMTGTITDSATLAHIYAGNAPGTSASFSPSGIYSTVGIAQVTTPAAAALGPVDLTVALSDGGIGIAPEAFSYGPSILEVTPNGATAEGGQLGAIVGYGFGSTAAGVQVVVGGQNAPVTVLHTSSPNLPYPFPAEALQFTVPPGVPGTAVDVAVTTSAGTVTAKAAFHYVPAVQSYPLNDTLQAGLYDSRRNLCYVTGKSQIEVFSTASKSWLQPISLPGITAKTRLLAVSESPDGTKLAVSDYGGQAIYVLDPDTSSSVQRFPMPIDYNNEALAAPSGLAITNSGVVYFAAADIDGSGEPAFFKLVTSTGVITSFNSGSKSFISNSSADRVLLSPDGSRVYASPSGSSIWLDTSNDQIHPSVSTSDLYGYLDIAISSDGSTVAMDGTFADPSLNAINNPAYIDWETWFPSSILGQKLNADGSILFQPLADGIDLIARNSGRLVYRIQLPVAPAQVYDPLFVAGSNNTLGVLTAAGLTFVDLSSISIPAPDAQPFPQLTAAAGEALPNVEENSGPVRPSSANLQQGVRRHSGLQRKGETNGASVSSW